MACKKLLIVNEPSRGFEILPTSFNNLDNWEIFTADSLSSLMFQIIINRPNLIVLVAGVTEIKEFEVVRVIRKCLGFSSPITIVTNKESTTIELDYLTELGEIKFISDPDSFHELITNTYAS